MGRVGHCRVKVQVESLGLPCAVQSWSDVGLPCTRRVAWQSPGNDAEMAGASIPKAPHQVQPPGACRDATAGRGGKGVSRRAVEGGVRGVGGLPNPAPGCRLAAAEGGEWAQPQGRAARQMSRGHEKVWGAQVRRAAPRRRSGAVRGRRRTGGARLTPPDASVEKVMGCWTDRWGGAPRWGQGGGAQVDNSTRGFQGRAGSAVCPRQPPQAPTRRTGGVEGGKRMGGMDTARNTAGSRRGRVQGARKGELSVARCPRRGVQAMRRRDGTAGRGPAGAAPVGCGKEGDGARGKAGERKGRKAAGHHSLV